MRRILILAICWLAFSGCRKADNKDGSLFVSGRIDGDTVDISFERSGQIVEISVREGDTVQAGQVLAVIASPQDEARRDAQSSRVISDQRRVDQLQRQLATYSERVRQAEIYQTQAQADAPGQVMQAEANLATTRANLVRWQAELQQSQSDAQRYAPLAKSGAVAVQVAEQYETKEKVALASVEATQKQVAAGEADVQRAKAQLENIPIKESDRISLERQLEEIKSSIASARADVEAGKAELRRIEADLSDLKVLAPIAGTILTRTAQPGRVVAPGQTILTMVDMSTLYLRGFIPEGNVGNIKVGQQAQVFLDSNPTEAIPASVIRIDPEAMFTPENTYFKDDRVKQVLGLKLGLQGGVGFAKPGMPADGQILIGRELLWKKLMSAELVVESHKLSKSYGSLKALDEVDFEVRPGEIFGFIGADGAGKTTAFRIMAGVLEAGGGEIRVLGKTPREARPGVGYLTQPFSLYMDLSIDENLGYLGGLREVPRKDFAERRETYFKLFDLSRFTERLAGRLSGGMKQKLALTSALIAGPNLLLLDEPTTGVDPVTRRDFWDALTSLATGGMSIIVATPYLDEAERCHRVALMERGKIYDIDTPAHFRSKMGVTRLEVKVKPLAKAEDLLAASPEVSDVQRFGDRLDIMAARPDEAEADLRRRAGENGMEVVEIGRSQPTLENAFVGQLRKMRGVHVIPSFPKASPPHGRKDVVIGARDLNKIYGSFQAVKNFQLEVRNGEIYGLLGANGAGKTTSIKIICGLQDPTSGSVTLMGKSKGLRAASVRSRIGYMSQKFSLYDDLTIGENLDFYARLYGVDESVREERKKWVLELSELKGESGMLTRSLPGGWKQRVAFGAAVMHEPDAIFLDEPTSGVDPLARRAMWRMINEFADRGAGILVVTHYLEEAEQCNRLGFMVAGEIISDGSPAEVKANMKGTLSEIETDHADRALRTLKAKFGASRVSLFGDRLHLVTENPEQKREALAALQETEVRVVSDKPIPFSLEDVFISLIESRRSEIPL